jgi:prophage regulatory protein
MQTNTTPSAQPERLLRIAQVEAVTGLKKTSIYDLQRKGKFPKPVKLSSRCVAWPQSAIDAWIANCISGGGGN